MVDYMICIGILMFLGSWWALLAIGVPLGLYMYLEEE